MPTPSRSLYIVFPEPDRIELREEPVAPPKPGEVLCQAEKSLISIGTESYCLQGTFDPGTNWAEWVKFPFRPGYSMVARVIAVGQGVDGLKEGDRIVVSANHQQFFTVRPEHTYVLPDAISDQDATWVTLACTTQLGVRRAALQLGESVGVVGLGMLGQLVVQYLALSGARRIVAIDPVQGRLDLARAHGATHTLAIDVQAARHAVESITHGKLLDLVFDVTGHPAVLAATFPLLRRLGRVVLLGDTPMPTQQHLGPGVVSNSLAILGIHGTMFPSHPSEFNPWTKNEMIALFLDYLIQGRMRVSDLVTHRFSPIDAPEVYQWLHQDRSAAIGVIFDWGLLS